MAMKFCPKCKVMKHRNAFWRNDRNKSGLQSWCIRCLKTYQQANRKGPDRKYEQTPARKDYQRAKARWRGFRREHEDWGLSALVRGYKRKWGTLPPKGRKGKYLGIVDG